MAIVRQLASRYAKSEYAVVGIDADLTALEKAKLNVLRMSARKSGRPVPCPEYAP
ncbi:hypothetical protein [Hongsoonwoonella zoysiae]|uniref:hypothetical protein n=1 Tax=Hongsoonwoonella zoysiae TaxID=2821844 RepID=UPI001FE75185|nr:hypothetical protein [Hongsoonwoonella zoysiae]